MLVAAAGLGAAALGAGLAWRAGSPKPALAEAEQAFWAARFERPLAEEAASTSASSTWVAAADFRGKPLLLNFWATWCAPCVKELPELAQFHREFKNQGWQVLGLAVDSPAAVQAFLKKLPVDFPQAMAGTTGTTLTRSLGNAQGGLPFSVAFDADGRIIWRKLGATNAEELRLLGSSHRPG
nr:TlpA disulfide reductase family protein [Roseateles koreensis]